MILLPMMKPFLLALKYKDTFEIFEIYQMYCSDYITIKAKYEKC